MGIKRFGDYDKTQAYGDFQPLPKGGYVVRILGATVHENSNGQYVKIAADIAEGEHQGYYNRDYQNQQSEDKKWHCHFLLSVPKDDGTEQDGWTKRKFKTFTEALEESNPGYHFDWDETKFKGLIIGGLFNEREYEKRDGSIGRATNFAQVCSVEMIRGNRYRIPDDRLLAKAGSGSGSSGITTDEYGFMNIPEGSAEELPFD